MNVFSKVFGTRSQREVKRIMSQMRIKVQTIRR